VSVAEKVEMRCQRIRLRKGRLQAPGRKEEGMLLHSVSISLAEHLGFRSRNRRNSFRDLCPESSIQVEFVSLALDPSNIRSQSDARGESGGRKWGTG